MKTFAKTTVALTTAATMMFTLAGCLGGGSNGTFYGSYKCSKDIQLCRQEDDFTRLIIDGDNITFDFIECSGTREESTSKGVLNDEKNRISWTVEGHFHGASTFTKNSDGDVVTMRLTTYSKDGTEGAKVLLDKYEKSCSRRESGWSSPL